MIQRKRELTYTKRPEIINSIRSLAIDHAALSSLEKQSYVASFIYSTMKLKVDDQAIWMSLAQYVSNNVEKFDLRGLSNIVYSFHKISHNKSVLFNFDDLFTQLELPLIVQLD